MARRSRTKAAAVVKDDWRLPAAMRKEPVKEEVVNKEAEVVPGSNALTGVGEVAVKEAPKATQTKANVQFVKRGEARVQLVSNGKVVTVKQPEEKAKRLALKVGERVLVDCKGDSWFIVGKA